MKESQDSPGSRWNNRSSNARSYLQLDGTSRSLFDVRYAQVRFPLLTFFNQKSKRTFSTYQNLASVTDQVNHIKSLNNLLLWYTADEPDGTSDPLDATVKASHLISSLDGGDGGVSGYHPVSLVLNCQNYFFEQVPIQRHFSHQKLKKYIALIPQAAISSYKTPT